MNTNTTTDVSAAPVKVDKAEKAKLALAAFIAFMNSDEAPSDGKIEGKNAFTSKNLYGEGVRLGVTCSTVAKLFLGKEKKIEGLYLVNPVVEETAAPVKKTAAKKPAAKKPVAKKSTAKPATKTAATKPAAKKPSVKKPAAKKTESSK